MDKPLKNWHYFTIFVLFTVVLLGLWKWNMRSNLTYVESSPHAGGPNADKVVDESKLAEYGKKLIDERRDGKR